VKCPHCQREFEAPPARTAAQAQCPQCGEYGIVELPSMNKKVCFSCHAEFDWHLKPNQKSVLIEGLKGEIHDT